MSLDGAEDSAHFLIISLGSAFQTYNVVLLSEAKRTPSSRDGTRAL